MTLPLKRCTWPFWSADIISLLIFEVLKQHCSAFSAAVVAVSGSHYGKSNWAVAVLVSAGRGILLHGCMMGNLLKMQQQTEVAAVCLHHCHLVSFLHLLIVTCLSQDQPSSGAPSTADVGKTLGTTDGGL